MQSTERQKIMATLNPFTKGRFVLETYEDIRVLKYAESVDAGEVIIAVSPKPVQNDKFEALMELAVAATGLEVAHLD